jgi:predicted Zn-dependent peptidase
LLAPLVYLFLLAMGITAAFGCGLATPGARARATAMLLAGWSLLGMGMGVYDWLLQNNHVSVEGSFLGSYANVGAFFIFVYIMFQRYTRAIEEVRQVNAGLEQAACRRARPN